MDVGGEPWGRGKIRKVHWGETWNTGDSRGLEGRWGVGSMGKYLPRLHLSGGTNRRIIEEREGTTTMAVGCDGNCVQSPPAIIFSRVFYSHEVPT